MQLQHLHESVEITGKRHTVTAERCSGRDGDNYVHVVRIITRLPGDTCDDHYVRVFPGSQLAEARQHFQETVEERRRKMAEWDERADAREAEERRYWYIQTREPGYAISCLHAADFPYELVQWGTTLVIRSEQEPPNSDGMPNWRRCVDAGARSGAMDAAVAHMYKD